MAEDMVEFTKAEGRKDGNMDDPGHGKSHVDKIPFRAVCCDGSDPVALAKTHGKHSQAEAGAVFKVLICGEGTPFPPDFANEYVRFVEMLPVPLKQVECSGYFHLQILSATKIRVYRPFTSCKRKRNSIVFF